MAIAPRVPDAAETYLLVVDDPNGHLAIEPMVPGALSFKTEISRTKVPSLRNICMRLWLGSHTSTSPSLVMVMQCTGLPNCCGGGPFGSQLTCSSVGGLP